MLCLLLPRTAMLAVDSQPTFTLSRSKQGKDNYVSGVYDLTHRDISVPAKKCGGLDVIMGQNVGGYPSTCRWAKANSRHVKPIFSRASSSQGERAPANNTARGVDTCTTYATLV